jgi:hypothetical protein
MVFVFVFLFLILSYGFLGEGKVVGKSLLWEGFVGESPVSSYPGERRTMGLNNRSELS